MTDEQRAAVIRLETVGHLQAAMDTLRSFAIRDALKAQCGYREILQALHTCPEDPTKAERRG